MKSRISPAAWCLIIVLTSGLATSALWGQASPGPLQRLFGGSSAQKKDTPPPPRVLEESYRLVEILVELAWLGDPLTFPYFIDARVDGPNLQVRGNVPAKEVSEHALKLARLNSPLPVVDSMRVNSSLSVRSVHMAPEKLQTVVQGSLRETLPRHAKNLEARCSVDGRVAVSGTVDTFEEKLAISQALRRLHGCTVVSNLVKVASDPDGVVARSITGSWQSASSPASPTPVAAVPNSSNPVPLPPTLLPATTTVPATPTVAPTPTVLVTPPPPPQVPSPDPGAPSVMAEPPAAQPGVVNGPGSVTAGIGVKVQDAADTKFLEMPSTVPATEPATKAPPMAIIPAPSSDPVTPPAPPISVTVAAPVKDVPRMPLPLLKKRIEQACPAARDVKLSLTSPGSVRIEIHIANAADTGTVADQIFGLPEVQAYRPDLHIIAGQ